MDGNSNAMNVRRMFPAGVIRSAGWQGDQALTENHLRGRQIAVDAGTTVQIMGVMDPAVIHRWRVNVGVTLASVAAPLAPTGLALRYTLRPSVESDVIFRRLTVPLNGGQTVFVVGRTLSITVENPSSIQLAANYNIDDQATSSPATWLDRESFTCPPADRVIDIPPFCQGFTVLQASAGPGVHLKGWDLAGLAVYDENLPAPRSAEIPVNPGLTYTLASLVNPIAVTIIYRCAG